MTGSPPMLDRDRQTKQIRSTVRQAKGYWRRAGVPRGIRRQKAEELHDHLVEAVDDGRTVEAVVGRDLAAFAAEWADAVRSRQVLDLVLQVAAAITLLPGGAALLNPVVSSWFGETREIGVPGGLAAFLAVLLPALIALQLIRIKRHRLTTQQTAILGVVLFGAYVVLFTAGQVWGSDTERFVAVSPVTAWVLVAVGVVMQGSAAVIKRSPWR